MLQHKFPKRFLAFTLTVCALAAAVAIGVFAETAADITGTVTIKATGLDKVSALTDGSLSPVACLEGESNECPRCVGCATLPVWKGLERVINEYLDSITVRDVIDGRIGEK